MQQQHYTAALLVLYISSACSKHVLSEPYEPNSLVSFSTVMRDVPVVREFVVNAARSTGNCADLSMAIRGRLAFMEENQLAYVFSCLLYTSDAADE